MCIGFMRKWYMKMNFLKINYDYIYSNTGNSNVNCKWNR